MGTNISWAEESWNFVTGCSKVSEGCRFCYAERISHSYNWTTRPWTTPNAEHNVKLHPERIFKPRLWKSPKRIFVNSMSDAFHGFVPDNFLQQAFKVMQECHWHDFLILTKRPERAVRWDFWPDNVWLGVSVENLRATERIDILRTSKARVKFVSFEPLIAPVGPVDLTGIAWAIVGGETGHGFRMMDHTWARQIREQCRKHGTAFYFKQSSGPRPETGTELIEANGSRAECRQYPDTRPDLQPTQAALF